MEVDSAIPCNGLGLDPKSHDAQMWSLQNLGSWRDDIEKAASEGEDYNAFSHIHFVLLRQDPKILQYSLCILEKLNL